jgi:hypothetical protein
MKRLMFVSLAVLVAAALVPQNLSAGFGIKGGYNLSKFSVASPDPIPFIFGNLNSPVGGVYFSLGLGPLAIQPEVLYFRMGSEYEIDEANDVKWQFDYIQVPLLLKLKVIPAGPIRPVIYAGGYGAYLIKANGVMTVDGEPVGTDIGDEYQKYDYGVIGGIGLDFKLPGITFSIEGRYNYGLKNIWIPIDPDDTTSWKNRSMTALVGIGF